MDRQRKMEILWANTAHFYNDEIYLKIGLLTKNVLSNKVKMLSTNIFHSSFDK